MFKMWQKLKEKVSDSPKKYFAVLNITGLVQLNCTLSYCV